MADVRFGLVQYRDFKDTFVAKKHDFTYSITTARSYVNEMVADGGGDGPEAVATGLNELLALDWRVDSTKVVVFIADAPPHGLESQGDDFPDVTPDQLDPIKVARALREKNIIIYSVGCEPAIQSYVHARSFMKSVANMTGGKYVPLARSDILAKVIVGGAIEEMELDKLSQKIEELVENLSKSNKYDTEEDLYSAASEQLKDEGVNTVRLEVEEVVPEEGYLYSDVFGASSDLNEAKSKIPKDAKSVTYDVKYAMENQLAVVHDDSAVDANQIKNVMEKRHRNNKH